MGKPKSTFHAWDRAVDGHLDAWLRKWRAEDGDSYADISLRLHTEHAIPVSSETVRRWCMERGIEKATAESAA